MHLKASEITRDFMRKREGANVFTALHPTSLYLEPGCVTVVLGRSGSGKSTLLNILSGLLAPTSGSVTADGEDLYKMTDAARSSFRARHFGLIPQGNSAVASLTVLENVLLPGVFTGSVPAEVREKARAVMERLSIAELAGVRPSELSGGEIRRAAIARALAFSPDVIFADEPTGDLDENNTREALTLLREEAARGAAVLLVTHDPEAPAYADRIFRMDAGTLLPETRSISGQISRE